MSIKSFGDDKTEITTSEQLEQCTTSIYVQNNYNNNKKMMEIREVNKPYQYNSCISVTPRKSDFVHTNIQQYRIERNCAKTIKMSKTTEEMRKGNERDYRPMSLSPPLLQPPKRLSN
mmetsp:Transcript_1409/g.2528  ORF Transcript_1409/g.2528 Transcript_1409/m.2528 type:complete len:117 (+) Transcript_1409:421-771(+)